MLELIKLKDLVFDMHQGINTVADKVEYQNVGVPIIQSKNITSGFLDLEDVRYLSNDDYIKYREKYKPNKEDMLFCNIGTIGKSLVIKEENDFLIAWNVFLIKVNKEKLIPEYLKYFLEYLRTINYFDRLLTGGTVKFINKKTLSEILIPVVSIKKQEEIVKILSITEEIINKRQFQITALDELMRNVFLEMFGDPVVNQKKLPKKKLGETGELKRGMSKHRSRNAPELLGGPYPLIQTGDVSRAGLFIEDFTSTYSELGLQQSKMWETGTLCITIAANIAKTSILNFDACFPDSVVGYKPFDNMNTIFVHYWFSFFQEILEASAPESAQKNINLKILNNIEIITPSIEQQNEFANQVMVIFEQKKKMEGTKSHMEDLYNSLLQKAFKGELFQN